MAEAQRMLDRLQLRNEDIQGKLIDLDELFKDCPHSGRFRIMVFQAAERILKKRGVNVTFAE